MLANLNPVSLMTDGLGEFLASRYRQAFPDEPPEHARFLAETARQVMARIARSDALYHNAEHTMLAVMAGDQIIRGKMETEPVAQGDWLHFMIAVLTHDIGFVRGVCSGDTGTCMVVDRDGATMTPCRGASDACLGPHHIERGKMFVNDWFARSPYIDAERIASAIEMTRFPVPDAPAYRDANGEAGLVRAADLIGQLADPSYHRKVNALYWELCETGAAKALGYRDPADVRDKFPRFYETMVAPYLDPALAYLEKTPEGRRWAASLDANVNGAEARDNRIGPFSGGA